MEKGEYYNHGEIIKLVFKLPRKLKKKLKKKLKNKSDWKEFKNFYIQNRIESTKERYF
jgi:hypothetical protein